MLLSIDGDSKLVKEICKFSLGSGLTVICNHKVKGDLHLTIKKSDVNEVTFVAQTLSARVYRSELRKRFPQLLWSKKDGLEKEDALSELSFGVLLLPAHLSFKSYRKLASSIVRATLAVGFTQLESLEEISYANNLRSVADSST
jgi:hypothetical protein